MRFERREIIILGFVILGAFALVLGLISKFDFEKAGQIGDAFNIVTSLFTLIGFFFVAMTYRQMLAEHGQLVSNLKDQDDLRKNEEHNRITRELAVIALGRYDRYVSDEGRTKQLEKTINYIAQFYTKDHNMVSTLTHYDITTKRREPADAKLKELVPKFQFLRSETRNLRGFRHSVFSEVNYDNIRRLFKEVGECVEVEYGHCVRPFTRLSYSIYQVIANYDELTKDQLLQTFFDSMTVAELNTLLISSTLSDSRNYRSMYASLFSRDFTSNFVQQRKNNSRFTFLSHLILYVWERENSAIGEKG